MTKIDFYVAAPGAAANRYQLACRVADKARRAGHRVVVHTASEEEARHMDRMLWTFNDNSFVPHARLGAGEPAINPILIGDASTAHEEHDVLINLGPEVPTFFSRFQRLAECVDNDDAIRSASRERYRYYRDRGYPLEMHEIG
jgi:DNA polymerase-3 subunit chi